jgi:predicted amidohydrolase YtcJ
MFSKYLLIFLGLIVYSGCTNDNKTMADVVVMNAEIWTGNHAQPHAEALAVKADTILAMGADTDIEKLVDASTIVINAQGKFITPGFIDAHARLTTSIFII